jgi:hypothetical protein
MVMMMTMENKIKNAHIKDINHMRTHFDPQQWLSCLSFTVCVSRWSLSPFSTTTPTCVLGLFQVMCVALLLRRTVRRFVLCRPCFTTYYCHCRWCWYTHSKRVRIVECVWCVFLCVFFFGWGAPQRRVTEAGRKGSFVVEVSVQRHSH